MGKGDKIVIYHKNTYNLLHNKDIDMVYQSISETRQYSE